MMKDAGKQDLESKRPALSPRRAMLWAAVTGIAIVAIATVFWVLSGRQAAPEYTPEVRGGPSAAIDQAVFDYGDVKLGTTIKMVFRVKNVGDTQLVFPRTPYIEVLEGC
jgi:hypothetical protein